MSSITSPRPKRFPLWRLVGLVAVIAAVSGCGGAPRIALAPSIEQAPGNELPLPAGLSTQGDYVFALGPLDKISIEVDGLPALLREEVVIDGQGMISYPIAGFVRAAGLTTVELAGALEARMREAHVRDPRVSVNIVEATSKIVTVDGEIEKPGLYPVYRDMTLMQAVAQAGGDGEYANSSVVLIFREAEGRQYVGLYDLKAIRLGNYVDPRVYPNDKIVVGESRARQLLELAAPFVSLVTTPLIYLLNSGP